MLTLLLLNAIISLIFKVNFIDVSIPVGLLGIVLTASNGGTSKFVSNSVRMDAQSTTGLKIEEEKKVPILAISGFFYTSIVYSIISFIITFYHYREYFI